VICNSFGSAGSARLLLVYCGRSAWQRGVYDSLLRLNTPNIQTIYWALAKKIAEHDA